MNIAQTLIEIRIAFFNLFNSERNEHQNILVLLFSSGSCFCFSLPSSLCDQEGRGNNMCVRVFYGPVISY